jgi:hypothetical protein
MEAVFYSVIITVYVTLVGFVVDTTNLTTLVVVARASGLLAALHFSFVVMSFISPLVQVLYLHLNFAFNIHTLRFHISMAVTTILFSFIHITAHSIQWGIDPIYSGVTIYSLTSPAFVTGVIIIISFLVSAICGYLKKPQLYFIHLLSGLVGCTAFFFHGSQQLLGFPTGDYMVLATAILCVATSTIYYFINPVDSSEVLMEDSKLGEMQIGEKFFFLLALRCTAIPIPPGSYFNIYIYKRYTKVLKIFSCFLLPKLIIIDRYHLFHAHPFYAVSSANGKVSFLIEKNQNPTSFTTNLYDVVQSRKYLHSY